MIKNGVVKIENQINIIDNFNSFSIIGDPGCDGLGAEIMSTFAKALTIFDTDFGIILGDIVPLGNKNFYNNVSEFINTISVYPVYLLCGNHDTSFYSEYFGLSNYILVNDKVLFIIIDNSKRKIDEAVLNFVSESLKKYSRDNIILLFHIPPPNSVCTNSMSNEEWEKLKKVYASFKSKIKYIICGHVHSYFEDYVDDIKLIVSGGGGARIEFVNDKIDKLKAFHHVLKFYFDKNNNLLFDHISLDGIKYDKELNDIKLNEFLLNAFQNECVAHIKYKIFSKDAEEKGFIGLSKLFNAASDSEFYHAINHFNALSKLGNIKNNLEECYKNEDYEVAQMYNEYLEYTKSNNFGLAKYAFFDALEAEKIHRQLFDDAINNFNNNIDIPVSRYFTCTSCGNTFKTDETPKYCPVCGAPHDKIKEN